MAQKIGKQSIQFQTPPRIISTGTVAGPFEGSGPLKEDFDYINPVLTIGNMSFEVTEREMVQNACLTALHKQNLSPGEVDYFIAGDLLNQIITAGFTALELQIPFFGIYGACSTAAEGLILSASLIDSGAAGLILAAASSHNSTAERQYRYPTEYGNQRKPFSQWTVTGAGAALVANNGAGVRIAFATVGTVTDMACKDPLNLGAAMAPAAGRTIIQHFKDTGRGPSSYDLILTGDLGGVGHELLLKWAAEAGEYDLRQVCRDAGVMIYNDESRVNAGGSGCGCSAVVTYGHIYRRLCQGELKRVLLVGTGAMHSPTSCQQGENIPCIAHAVALESEVAV